MEKKTCGNCIHHQGKPGRCCVDIPEWVMESIGDSEEILRSLPSFHEADNCDLWQSESGEDE